MRRTVLTILAIWTAGAAMAFAQPPAAAPLPPAATLRLTVDDAVKMATDHNVDLAAARIDPQISDMSVVAAAGVFRPAGTQFEVRVADGVTRVKVREGTVRLEGDSETARAAAGEALVVAADGRVSRRPIPPFGPEWDWVLASAPVPAIEETLTTLRNCSLPAAFSASCMRRIGPMAARSKRNGASMCTRNIVSICSSVVDRPGAYQV